MSALTRYPVPQAIVAGKTGVSRLHFRLEPTPVLVPVLDFLRPFQGLEAIKAGAVDKPRLYFRLEAAVVTGTRPPSGLVLLGVGS